MINFGLKCFTNLGLAYIHHSAHILFVYKLVLVILILGVYMFIGVLYSNWTFRITVIC